MQIYKVVALAVLLMLNLTANCAAFGKTDDSYSSNLLQQDKVAIAMPEPLEAETNADEKQRKEPIQDSAKQKNDNRDLGNAIAATAKKYVGVPYVWGGTTPDGFDCSGYTMYVFAKHGIDLPRTADIQFEVGYPIGKNELYPGDLVFFETYAPGASHVGIYIGEGEFLHTSVSKGAIAVARLDNSYFVERYIGSRRYY